MLSSLLCKTHILWLKCPRSASTSLQVEPTKFDLLCDSTTTAMGILNNSLQEVGFSGGVGGGGGQGMLLYVPKHSIMARGHCRLPDDIT